MALWPGPAEACRLALVLALDVSSSVNPREDALQRGGTADALQNPSVQAAFLASPDPVALTIFEWSGRFHQHELLGWTLIETPADLDRAAEMVRTSQRQQSDQPTALGHALGHAVQRMAEAPACQFQTIDVSGDGENNDGFGPAEAYAALPFDGVTVNGLAIIDGAPEGPRPLVPYYQREVLHGPLAFVEIARGFEDFADTMQRKLIREVSAQVIGMLERPRQ